jgi:hypothetical protein
MSQENIFNIITTVLIISNGLWALAFFNIYQNQHVRITASAWIEKNIAEQSIILHEERDERLPVMMDNNKSYQYSLLELYQNDSLAKIEQVSNQLAEGNYLIIASQRLYRTIPRSDVHPYTSHYYQLLFAQQLGYQKIMEFNAYPNLFGITIQDDGAEETFEVFDHPKIFIFQNIGQLNNQQLRDKILQINN